MPRSPKQDIHNRRKEVAELYLKGWFQADIAQKFKVTQQQISSDLKVIYRLWRQSSIRDFDEMKQRELIKIDNLEKEYWSAWEKSKEDYEKTRKKYLDKQLKELQKEDMILSGEPRFLSGVQWCINKRCEILGINAPVKTENTNIDRKTVADLFPDELKDANSKS